MNPDQPTNNQQFPQQNTPPAPTGVSDQGQFTPNPSQPPQNKKTGLMVGIVVAVLVVIGVVAFALMGSNKKDSSKTTNNTSNSSTNPAATPDNLKKFDVTDKTTGLMFSVSFFKDGRVEEKNGRTYLNAGETGSLQSVYLGAATSDKIDCEGNPSTTMTLAGEPTTVCYRSDNTQYAGYTKSKSGTVRVNLAGQKAISIDDAKAIMASVKFN